MNDFPEKSIDNNVACFLQKHAVDSPDKTVFYYPTGKEISEHKTISFKNFHDRSVKLAHSFKKLNVKEGDRLIVFMPISVELYLVVAALQYIGAVPVFLDSWGRREHMTECIKNSRPVGIVSINETLKALADNEAGSQIPLRISCQDHGEHHQHQLSELFVNDNDHKESITPVRQDDTALITYTTGSSGEPKGVNRTHRFLTAQHYALKRLFPYAEHDIDLSVFPVFALNNIASGISTVIPAINPVSPSANDPHIILSQAENCEVNCMTLSPHVFNAIAFFCIKEQTLLKGINRVLVGGAPISEKDIERFISIAPDTEIQILYGSTEVEPIAYIKGKDMLEYQAEDENDNPTLQGVNVGKIDTELRCKFIKINHLPTDSSAKQIQDIEVPAGEVGELLVTGEHVCRDYYNNPKAFANTKIKDQEGAIWHRTGDLARIDQTGHLWIVGRTHNVIKHNGELYFPVRPEILLKGLPYVSNAAYLKDLDEKILAVVTVSDEDPANQEKYKREIEALFTREKIPLDDVVFYNDIPMDVRHHSKVDYRKLKQALNELSQK